MLGAIFSELVLQLERSRQGRALWKEKNRAMSKREISAPGWTSASQSHMATDPSVGSFSNDQTVSLLAKDSSAKFRDNDRTKSLAPFSNHGQHLQQPSQQPSQRPAGTDIVDLRTSPESEWKAIQPAKPRLSSQRHCSWYSIVE